MSKLSNTLLLLSYLQNGKKYSIQELADKLEVSPRMVRIYKDDLEKAGILIESIYGPYGGYILRKNNMSITSAFNEYDLKMLAHIKTLAKDDRIETYMKTLLDRIKIIVHSNDDKIVTEDIQKTYNCLSKAIKEKRKVKIIYDSLNKGLNERIIHPLELFYIKDGFGVAAFCEKRMDLRHFELKRIKKVKILEEVY